MTDAELVTRLARLDSCAVSDALDRLGLKGSVVAIHALYPTARIAGRAVTVKLAPAGLTTSTRHLCTSAIEAAQPGDIIVVDHSGRLDCAGWGGILSTAAQVKGLGGVVIDGACRDVDEARELGLPVFARAPVQITARGRIVEVSTNEPIAIAGVAVCPGDLVIADASGVVFVAAQRAEEVIGAAEEIAAREATMTQSVLAGKSVAEVMGKRYEAMLDRNR